MNLNNSIIGPTLEERATAEREGTVTTVPAKENTSFFSPHDLQNPDLEKDARDFCMGSINGTLGESP